MINCKAGAWILMHVHVKRIYQYARTQLGMVKTDGIAFAAAFFGQTYSTNSSIFKKIGFLETFSFFQL